MNARTWKWWLSASAMSFAVACSGGNTGEPGVGDFDPDDPQPVPSVGQSNFVSADGQNGEASQDNRESGNNDAAPTADEAGAGNDADARTVEEGDIYQVMEEDSLILNLNAFRGLQIIDFSDVSEPEVIGRVQVSGTPVEMYQVGDRVFALINNWRGYWGSRDDIAVDTFEGGLVLAIDVSDPSDPKVTGQATIPGWIRKSRLTRGNGDEALFVVASEWGSDTTYVKSFKVSDTGTLAEKSLIDLGGYVTDVQASPELLMVARWDWSRQAQGSDITLIDITDPSGTMVEGETVTVKGMVQKKTNMDHREGVLRVVSGNDWSNNTNTNHVETFDVTDIQNVAPIDAETFGDGENLFGTIFMDDRAFFVTYQQVDPFHAFSVSADGQLEERSEFIISGWNDWFRPVEQNSRLVGIGYNDVNGTRALAVSLYDITDLDNRTPLIQRATMPQQWGWSEATWDDRAFSVLEKGTAVQAPNGTLETGLVLLPFSGWSSQYDRYESGVQIFTFSDSTLTARGVMKQDTQVRRSFMADDANNTTANLGEIELSLFDTTDPDSPDEHARLELAPNYSAFTIFGDYGVRRHDNYAYWYWWGANSTATPTDTLQVVSLNDDVDTADAVAEIEIPTGANIYKVADLLVSVNTEYLGYTNNRPDVETTVEVWDMSDPTSPVAKGDLVTTDLPPQYGYYDYYGRGYIEDDVAVAGLSYGYYGGGHAVQILDDALVFTEIEGQQELEGTVKRSYEYPREDMWNRCYDQTTYEPKACTFLSGSRECSTLTRVGGTVEDEVCFGSFYECTQDDTGATDCEETTVDPSKLEKYDSEYEQYRYWSQFKFKSVDLSDADAPKLGSTIDAGQQNEAVSVLAKADKLYFSYKRPHKVPGDSRPFVKYYFQELDYSDAAAPVAGAEVNIPGELLEVDGETLITRDFLWGQNIIETSINKLKLSGGTAYLKGVNRFRDRQVQKVALDGAGNVLVAHHVAWLVNYQQHSYYDWDDWDNTVTLSILDMQATDFEELSTVPIDDWAHLQGGIPGKALFTVPGGMLVVNIADAANPHAQAYFALRGWPQQLEVEGTDIYFAAGPFGMYAFDSTEYNLSPAP